MGRNATDDTGFAWLAPHDHAVGRARMLFALALAICALYVAAGLALLAVVLDAIEPGALTTDGGAVDAVVLAVVVACALALGALGAWTAWRRLRTRRRRIVGGRLPDREQTARVRPFLESLAEPYGIAVPRLWIVDDPAPNGASFGSPRDGDVCLTLGALRLRDDELEALCRYHVTALAARPLTLVVEAIELTLLAEWCTRIVWCSAIFGFGLALLGANRDVAAAWLVATFLLILVTRVLLVVADRALPRLLDDACELVDLETIRRSAEPEHFASLLLALLEDDRRTRCRWDVAHLWFERDVVLVDRGERVGIANGLLDGVAGGFSAVPLAGKWDRTRHGLRQRAVVAVNLADGDQRLRERLARVAH
jgi:hypothetical protein